MTSLHAKVDQGQRNASQQSLAILMKFETKDFSLEFFTLWLTSIEKVRKSGKIQTKDPNPSSTI